jgi:hypothetical protein
MRITQQHLHAVRPTARMVFSEWPAVVSAIRTAVCDRGHPPPIPVGNSGIASRHRRARRPAVRVSPRWSGATPEFLTSWRE